MAEKRGEEIALDVQVTGGCMIMLDETAGLALFDVLGTWLASQGVQIG